MKMLLKESDKIMIASHGKILGITDIKEVRKETVILTKTHFVVGEEIPKIVNKNDFIISRGLYDVFRYSPLSCKALGVKFKKF